MEFECIIYEKEEGIATIKLNRPKVLNAMNKQLWLDFQEALEDVKNDQEIKVLIRYRLEKGCLKWKTLVFDLSKFVHQ